MTPRDFANAVFAGVAIGGLFTAGLSLEGAAPFPQLLTGAGLMFVGLIGGVVTGRRNR